MNISSIHDKYKKGVGQLSCRCPIVYERKEYLIQLEQLLTGLPDVEKQEALEYVKEYIEEAKSSGVSDYMATLPLAEEFADL